ncbi:unnamed protein product [Ceutorhynchus assimilis]|uniref:Fe2OG dioxygenase domain-containing protein n=1 Tax=Ceutorhynchus assimilis TaxID=467358 RepID=A0A9N9MY83_9CUCU|nr:unnamed protein product [Ceutorhynchus assimilis]
MASDDTKQIKYRRKQFGKKPDIKEDASSKNTPTSPYKYGPMPKFSGQRIISRLVMIAGVLVYVWYFTKSTQEKVFAKHDTIYHGRGQHVECDPDYLKEIQHYTGCVPKKCGRFVTDRIVTDHEADVLLWLAKRGMSYAGSNGGASIMDLHSGALSYKDSFINFYKSIETTFVTPTDLKIYHIVRQNIQAAIADFFGININKLHLTHPTFFSRLTSKEATNIHDEYWHVHVDKHTYESFHYTSLLYLNDYGTDFQGGRFIFQDNLQSPKTNSSVEPRKGRVSMFTSGAENPHFVERVTEGERFAITISFTCDETKKISDPSLDDKK